MVLNLTTALLSPAKNSKFFLEPILQKLNLKFIFYIESYGRAKLKTSFSRFDPDVAWFLSAVLGLIGGHENH